ncbi:Synaptobrevin like protein [Aduncisulcus paluster]|uniref:Synaptobrevin like protein n=1 Tax=Aduncisulcus paluster TaxID=2918883 RepID=A0ABQ5K0U8_9EUKA|nr:Synaptobrevin like protein [Aduncisulcus paluster]
MSGIFYSLISRTPTELKRQYIPLVECSTSPGNHKAIALHIMKEKIDLKKALSSPRGYKESFPKDDIEIHVYVIHEICYLTMASVEVKRSACLAYLESIQSQFETMFGLAKIKTASAYEFNTGFQGTVKKNMEKTSSEKTKVDILEKEVSEVQVIMQDNLNKAVARGDKIKLLINHSSELATSSRRFGGASRKLKQKEKWKNLCYIIGGSIILAIILSLLITYFACGSIWCI